MATTLRPGVYVDEVRSPSVAAPTPDNAPAVAAFIGPASQGPTTPTYVTSWRQFVQYFGDVSATTDLALQVRQFFLNRGRSAYVQRIVSATAVAATKILLDRAGTPLSTMSVTALSKGAWGNNLSISVTDGLVATGTGATFNVVVNLTNAQGVVVPVERYVEVTLDQTSSRYVVNVINSVSQYIVVTDTLSATAAPTNRPAATTLALTTGSDGTTIATTDWTPALAVDGTAPFDQISFPLLMVLAGVQSLATTGPTTVINAAIAYAEYRKDTFIIADTAKGLTATTALTASAGYTKSDKVGVYFPWVKIPDPLTSSVGAVRTVSPAGSVAGYFQYSDTVNGVWKNPAGVLAQLANVVATETVLTSTDLDNLNSNTAPINAIKVAPGAGIIVNGARTLDQSKQGTNYVGGRRVLIAIEKGIADATQFAVFETNDPLLWNRIKIAVESILTPLWLGGGLKGATADEAFVVTCDSTLNTPAVVDSGTVLVEIAVALSKPAEFVVLRVGQTQSGSAVTYVG